MVVRVAAAGGNRDVSFGLMRRPAELSVTQLCMGLSLARKSAIRLVKSCQISPCVNSLRFVQWTRKRPPVKEPLDVLMRTLIMSEFICRDGVIQASGGHGR